MDLIRTENILFGEGWVWHARPSFRNQQFGFFGRLTGRAKLSNSFRYPIFNLLIPVHSDNSSSDLDARTGISVKAENYLNSQKGDLKETFFQFLKTEFDYSCDHVWLQTLPGIFGYAFNPISFWYCYKNGQLNAVLCEVNNTFGDRHYYFIQEPGPGNTGRKKAIKKLHVSPFMDVSGYYTFEFDFAENKNQVRIRLFDADENLKIDTQISLSFRDFRQVSLVYILKKYGWLTVMVIWRIHFQALKIWLKGAKFYTRPLPSKETITYDSSEI